MKLVWNLAVTSFLLFSLASVSHGQDPNTTETSSVTSTTITLPSTTTETTVSTPVSSTTHTITSTTKTTTRTTHTPAPVTTPMPTPMPTPEPKKQMWFVNGKDNVTCILFEAMIRLTFNYTLKDDTMKTISVYVPANTTASGNCAMSEMQEMLRQNIVLSFFDNWKLLLEFEYNKTSKGYGVKKVILDYEIIPGVFPNAKQMNTTNSDNNTFVTPKFWTGSTEKYLCVATQTLVDQKDKNVTNGLVAIDTMSMTFEAFRNSTNKDFSSSAVRCSADEVSQLVPIIVGAALGGLILIVLIAYLIGRKRSRRGYESV